MQLKGDSFATIDRPPSHQLFDNANIMSPVLAQCKAAQDAKNATTSNTSSSVEFTMSNFLELATILHQPPPSFPYPSMASPPDLAQSCFSTMLLPPSRTAGPDLSLQEFCQQYDVSDAVQTKLIDEGYTRSRVLQYVAIADLKEVGLKLGEIASLKDAVARWSVPPL